LNDKIRSRKTVTTTQDKTEFTTTAKCFFFAVLLAPLSFALLRWQLGTTEKNWPLLASSLALSLAPLLVTLTALVIHYCKAEKDAGSEVIAIFKGQAKESTRRQFIRDENPTSTEFRQTFEEILRCVKRNPNQNELRFVIVLDNIDRLPEDNIPDLWAELRTFFAYGDNTDTPNSNPITIIVPYDKRHILSCLVSSDRNDYTQNEDVEAAALGPHKEDIFHKTFAATYRVSTPVLSDTKKYFLSQIESAFNELISEPEAIRIYQLFNHWMTKEKRKQSPRLIISFINELVILWNSRGANDIPILALSLFSLRRGKFEANIQVLKNSSYVDQFTIRHLADLEWAKFTAALHFNVDTNLAYQVLLGDDIKNSLFSRDGVGLTELENHAGFIPQLLSTIDENISMMGRRTDLPLHRGLTRIKELKILQPHDKDHILRAFINASHELNHEDSIDDLEKLFDGLMYPLEHFRNRDENASEQYAVSVHKYFLNLLQNNRLDKDVEQQKFGHHWFRLYNEFLQKVMENTSQNTLNRLVRKEVKYPSYEYLYGMANMPTELVNIRMTDFNITVDQKFHDEFKIKIDSHPSDANKFTQFFGKSLTSHRAGALAGIITTYLDTVKIQSTKKTLELLKALLNLSKVHFEKSSWKKITASGAVYKYYSDAVSSENYEVAANIRYHLTHDMKVDVQKIQNFNHRILGSLNNHVTVFKQRTNHANVPIDSEVEHYSITVTSNGKLTSTADLANAIEATDNFYQESFRYAVERLDSLGRLTITKIGYNYENYSALLGEELSLKFLTKFTKYSYDFEKRFESSKTPELPTKFLRDIASLSLPKLNIIPKIQSSHLKTINQEKWLDALLSENELLQTAITLKELGYTHGVSTSAFRPALLEATKQIIDQTYTPKSSSEIWSKAPQLLKANSRNSWNTDVLKHLENKDTLSSKEIINLFSLFNGSEHKLTVSQLPDTALLKILVPLLSSEDAKATDLIAQLKEGLIDAYAQAKQSTKDELIENLETENDVHQMIADWFKITLTDNTEKGDDETPSE